MLKMNELIAKLRQLKNDQDRIVTATDLRRLIRHQLNLSPMFNKMLAGNVSFDRLEAVAEILRHKDGDDRTAGEFIRLAIPILRREKKDFDYAKKWNQPNTCSVCGFRLTTTKTCWEHSRVNNQAGYRRGLRIKKRLDPLPPGFSRQGSQPPFEPALLKAWLTSYAPSLVDVHSGEDLFHFILRLDAPEKDRDKKFREQELHKMARNDLSHHNISKVYLLRADAWFKAASIETRGRKKSSQARKKLSIPTYNVPTGGNMRLIFISASQLQNVLTGDYLDISVDDLPRLREKVWDNFGTPVSQKGQNCSNETQ